MSKSSTPIPRPNAAASEPNPVADFDVDAWRKRAIVPTDDVAVTNDPGAGQRLIKMESREEEIRAAEAEALATGKPIRGKRAASKNSPELEALIADMKVLLAELDGTWLYVHLRALDPVESEKVSTKADRDEKNGLEGVRMQYVAEVMEACATLSPVKDAPGIKQTAEQWLKTFKAIGVAQTLRLEKAANALASAQVSPDFSRRISALLEEQGSSSN